MKKNNNNSRNNKHIVDSALAYNSMLRHHHMHVRLLCDQIVGSNPYSQFNSHVTYGARLTISYKWLDICFIWRKTNFSCSGQRLGECTGPRTRSACRSNVFLSRVNFEKKTTKLFIASIMFVDTQFLHEPLQKKNECTAEIQKDKKNVQRDINNNMKINEKCEQTKRWQAVTRCSV